MECSCSGAIGSAYIKANSSMYSLVEKQMIEDGEQYIQELQYAEYGNQVQQHDNAMNVMKDERDNDSISS
ncbi:MAG: hypothetical protein ACXWWC_02600 [Chitinophagaceae bacterium]